VLVEPRHPTVLGRERRVAAPAATALGDDGSFPLLDEVGEHLPGRVVHHDGAHRHAHDLVDAVAAVLVVALSTRAVLGPPVGRPVEVDQRRDVRVGQQDDVTAAPTVATVGSAARDVRLPAERGRAVPTTTPTHVDGRLVDELDGLTHRWFLSWDVPDSERGRPEPPSS
jgi:hypothetical protein